MFKRLRNRFILTNVLMTTAILVVAFGSIFAFNAMGVRRDKPHAPREFSESAVYREVFEKEIEHERTNHLVRLAITMVCVGLAVEIMVFIASYYLAEKSIQPVKQAYNKQREFIANASHELKTPIAAVQANFEALGTTEQPWADNIENELSRASNLVNDLLALARTDGRTIIPKKKDVNIAKIIRARTQLIEARLGDKKLEIAIPEKQSAIINEADFTQILDIFLDNAVKYSAKRVTVKLEKSCVIVENDGKMIPKEKLERVFDRFYQTDKTAEGSGLGLAIAKAVAEQNGWKIWAESENRTTRFSVSF